MPAKTSIQHAVAWDRFHKKNPHVYDELVKLARQWKLAGNDHASIKMFFEVLRFNSGLGTSGTYDFKLNNNYHAIYSRVIMERETDLAGMFDIREKKTFE